MAVLLYYPLVSPPTEVVHQALLYWDGLASVVPRRAEVYEAVVPEELRRLQEHGFYQPVALVPESLDEAVPPGRQWFSLSGRTSVAIVDELRRLAARPRPPRPADPPGAVLHVSKLSHPLERELLRLHLAERSGREFGELAVSQEVQTTVIGVLARELARDTGPGYVPYTDDEDAHRAGVRPRGLDRSVAWEMELGRLLPVPAPGTATADVLAFRERYADERVRLMRALHRLLGGLRRDYEHPADVFAQLRVELSHAVDDYRAAVRSSRMAWLHRSVMVTVALAAAAGGTLLMPDLGWLLGTVGGYALNVATREIRPLIRARDTHDFSYLHRVHSDLT